MKVLIFSFLIVISSVCYTQTKFKKGYVIKNNGDSISGLIDCKSNLKTGIKCIFKDLSNEKVEYSPDEISSFRILGDKYYVSKIIQENNQKKNVFLEYLVDGQVDLFYFKNKANDHFFIENNLNGLLELKNSEITVEINNENFQKYKKEYIGILKIVLNEYSEMQIDIEKIEYNHSDLVNYIKAYNNFVCPDEICVSYKKDIKLRYSFGYVFGIKFSKVNFNVKDYKYRFLENENFKYTPSISTGLLLSIENIFGFNSKLNFNFGISYRKDLYSSENIVVKQKNLYLPIYFTYNFPTGNFRPLINLGFGNTFSLNSMVEVANDYHKDYLEQAISKYQINGIVGLGVIYRKKKTSVSLYSDYEIGSGIIESGRYSQLFLSSYNQSISINLGVKYHF